MRSARLMRVQAQADRPQVQGMTCLGRSADNHPVVTVDKTMVVLGWWLDKMLHRADKALQELGRSWLLVVLGEGREYKKKEIQQNMEQAGCYSVHLDMYFVVAVVVVVAAETETVVVALTVAEVDLAQKY